MTDNTTEATNSEVAEVTNGKTGCDPALTETRVNRITYPEDLRFNPPSAPSWSVLGSVFSIITLIFMSIFSTAILVKLTTIEPFWLVDIQLFISAQLLPTILGPNTPFTDPDGYPAWTWIPFAFTVFGSTLGALFESFLLLIGQPFQFYNTKLRRFIARIRVANVVPVLFSLLFYVTQISIASEAVRIAILLIVIASIVALVFNLMFMPVPVAPPPSAVVPMILLGTQVFGIMAVLFNHIEPQEASLALLVGSVLMIVALLITTATPVKSAGFHTFATIATVQAYFALFAKEDAFPGFSYSVDFSISVW